MARYESRKVQLYIYNIVYIKLYIYWLFFS